jgi:hypothetical protein
MVPLSNKQLLGIAAIAVAVGAWSFAAPGDAHGLLFRRHYGSVGSTAPEVDPGALGSVVALAMGGLAVLSDKLRRR